MLKYSSNDFFQYLILSFALKQIFFHLNIKIMRISSKRSGIASKIKIFCFDFLFNFQNNSIQNPSLLLFLDLLDLLTLPCMYINPIYTHLTNQPVFNIFFSQIYPNFYHFSQNPQKQKFPIALLIFCICIVVLTFFKNSKPNLIIMIVQIILATLPIFIFRIASQFANLFRSDLNYQIVGFLFFVINLVAIGLVLFHYEKKGKFADFVVGFMLFMNVNQYALMGALCLKIILISIVCKMYHTKFIKIGLQASLLISVLCLKFVKPVTINYIMFLILIGLGLGYPGFNMFINLKYKDLSRIKPDQDDQYCTQSSYSMSEVEYFKHLNKHINSCLQLGCKCKEILYIKGLKDLKRWVPAFNKSLIKRKIQNIKQIKSKISSKPSDYFDTQIQYVKNCFESEQIDFEGFIILNKLQPQNIFQQYKKYENQKKYKQLLEKLNPKFLKMTLIKQSQNGNTFDQILRLQNKICELIEKIKEFWTHLLNYQHNNVFAELIYQISDDIIDITNFYDNVEERYDEKEEAQFYFQIFRLLAIHQKPQNSLLSTHLSNYLMVTKGDIIINVTTNLTHLMQKSKNALINNKYTKLMFPVHTNGHSLWVKQFLSKYNPTQQNNFIKIISIGGGIIKVVKMMHLIIPSFSTSTSTLSQLNSDHSQSTNELHDGVFVVTCIKNKSKQEEEQGRKQKTIFHLLVCRQTLDIIGYQSTIFDYFNAKNSIDNSNKILRSNLKIMFPNLNRQAILKKNPAAIRRLIAKQNIQFFEKEQYDMKVQMTQPTEDLMVKKIPQRVLYISEVPNKKNQQLNLLLLSFELSVKKHQKQNQVYKKSLKKIEQDKWKQKTLKNLKETKKKKKIDEKQSQSHKTLNIIKIVLITSFLFSFGLIIAIFTEFETISNQLQPFNDKYDSKSIVRAYQSYTEAYLLGFPFGQNKQSEVEQYWQFNSQYSDIATVFKYIKQLPFISKFNSYIKQFRQRQSYEDLSDLVAAFGVKIQKLKVAISIIFYTGILMLIINLVFNFAILIKIEEKAIKIVERFLKIDCEMIKTNIWKIKQLQKWLEVSNYQEEEIILVSQNSNHDEKGELKKQSVKKQPTYTGVNIMKRSNKKTRTRLRRTSIQFQSQNQVYFEIVLNQFLKQGPQINEYSQQNDEKESSIVELSTKNLEITQQQIPKEKIKSAKVTMEKNIQKQKNKMPNIKQKQLSEEQQQSQDKISLWESVYKNSLTLIPSIVCFILKLSLLLLLLLLVCNFLVSVQRSIYYKHRLYYEPIVIMNTMQSEYWSPSARNEIVLIKYYEENKKLLEQLPSQFAEFVEFQKSLNLAERKKLLCDFMQRTPQNKQSQNLYNQCTNNSQLFETGIEILIEHIQTKIRKINTGELDRAELLKQNQLTLTIKVCLSIYRNRNKVFTDVYLRYLKKYQVIRTAIRYSIISIFLLCLVLQIREFNYTEKRINRTQNLFKIVPPFMKNTIKSLQIQNI